MHCTASESGLCWILHRLQRRQMWAETAIWCLISGRAWLRFTNMNFINFSNVFFGRWVTGSFDIAFKFTFFPLPVFSQAVCSKEHSLLGMLSLLLQFDQVTCPAASHIAGKGKLASAFLCLSLFVVSWRQSGELFLLRGQVVKTLT